MAKDRPFGSIEPIDKQKMKLWLGETGVTAVRVIESEDGEHTMQRVGPSPISLGVKKRFQKAPKGIRTRVTGESLIKEVEKDISDNKSEDDV
jgi:hypothetical protein